ncbi:MAG: hypothetical protein PSX37_02495 [bacterium]|nr:hypothetical protein [bacterium]
MVTPEDEPAREPVDPVFASLFRPEDLEPPPEEPAVGDIETLHEPDFDEEIEAQLALPDSVVIDELDSEDDIVDAEFVDVPPPPAPATTVDTGRLFRSQGASNADAAVLALNSDHGGKLRTLVRVDEDPSAPVRVNSAVAPTSTGMVLDDLELQDDVPVKKESRSERRKQAPRELTHRSPGISAGAVYLIVIGATVIVGMVNAWLSKGELGAPTGIALLVSSVYCAWRVRRDDDVVAIIIPPIAFFIAAITAGQLFRGTTSGGLLNRVQLVFFTMAYNWYWVIGTTVIVVVLVLVRRRRG